MTLAELEAEGWVVVGVLDEGHSTRVQWREVLIKREVPEDGARVVVLEVQT